MGAGKTTLGKVLAKKLGVEFIDLDHYIESRYRKTIPQLFAENGEDGFREIERKMLHEAGEFENVIISTGGGTPCFFDNMDYMNHIGNTVFLKVSVDELAARLEIAKAQRPVLKGKKGEDLKTFISENLEKRKPFYNKAKIHFEAETMSNEKEIEQLAQQLVDSHLLAI
jgi:shikimate kinase